MLLVVLWCPGVVEEREVGFWVFGALFHCLAETGKEKTKGRGSNKGHAQLT